jgi:integrase
MSTKKTKKTRKPKTSVGPIRIRAVRGPRDDGAWYWRAVKYEGGKENTVLTMWGSQTQVERVVAAHLAAGTEDEPKARQADRVDSVKDLLEVWVASQDARHDISNRTQAIYRLSGRHLITLMGSVILRRLDTAPMETYRDTRIRGGAATRTVELDLEILRRAWNWAMRRGLVENRKLSKVKIEHKPVRDKYTPSREEFWRVVDALDRWPALALIILGSTGGRIGEIAAMKWEEMDLDRCQVLLDGKNGPRPVSIPSGMVEEFKKLMPTSGTGRVFEVTEGTMRSQLSQQYLKNVCPRIGVRYFTPHAVRRMVLDQYYDNGVDVGTVAAQLGQSPGVALKYYRQATRTNKQRAVAVAGIGERPAVETKVLDLEQARRKREA